MMSENDKETLELAIQDNSEKVVECLEVTYNNLVIHDLTLQLLKKCDIDDPKQLVDEYYLTFNKISQYYPRHK